MAARRLLALLASLAPLAALAGCHADHHQSALHPAGPAADKIVWLTWLLTIICTVVFVIVIIMTLAAVFYRRGGDRPSRPLGNKFIIISGVILPSIILIGMLFGSLDATFALRRPETDLTIKVIGHQWWWQVRYEDHDIITANELYIPAGRPVHIELETADVIHSFWVPNLSGKMDMTPDMTNHFWIQADRPGRYRGQCAEFCGVQHALMAFWVVALPPDDFAAWIAERQRPVEEPQDEVLLRGREAFRTRCSPCHAVRGMARAADRGPAPAVVGIEGPDLTHIGSRLTLGAGTLPNNHGNLTGWIANPQPIKPGNFMPPTLNLSSEDFHALVAWLETLK